MGLYKRGQTWWISFSYNGRQVRQSTETDDKKLAEKIYHKVLTDVAEGKWLDKLPGAKETFRDMMGKYMEEHSKPNKASYGRDALSIKHLLPSFADYYVTDITPKLIQQYKTKRRRENASPCSINRELALMKHAYTLAINEWEWAQNNPVKQVSLEKEPAPRDRWLTYEEEKDLLQACPTWVREIVLFALETGCRRGEILSLLWRDCDLSKKVVTIYGKKTGNRRTIPLSRVSYELLKIKHKVKLTVLSSTENYLFVDSFGQKIGKDRLTWAFKSALKKVGITDFRFHDLRHTFATRLSQAGVDPYTVQTLMGHKSFSTTKRYAHHHTESLRRGITVLDNDRTENCDSFITILSQ
ncbi:MAG: Tyrosine recombinase XerC [Syntrophorhabdus sp. PtaB.Bin006]|nr:MAG: Tyrosine recombinase XerC [Syntrophorhabdus sp. PtaB.Bin006]